MAVAETVTSLAASLMTALVPRREALIETNATTPLAQQLDVLMQELAADSNLNADYRKDLETLLSSAITLVAQLGDSSFSFDHVIAEYTKLQKVMANLISHAATSRPRINGWGLTHNDKVLPFFSMANDEAARMRDGMGGIALDVVGVEIIHSSGFRPAPPPPPATDLHLAPEEHIAAPATVPVFDAQPEPPPPPPFPAPPPPAPDVPAPPPDVPRPA